jgi:hypothetical protein
MHLKHLATKEELKAAKLNAKELGRQLRRQKKQVGAKLEQQQTQIIELHAQVEKKSKELILASNENQLLVHRL